MVGDSDKRPSIGFVYDMLQKAKNDTRVAWNRKWSILGPIINISLKTKNMLEHPVHLAAYCLNPYNQSCSKEQDCED